MHYSVRMLSRKSPQIGVSLNERLLKHFLLLTDSFIIFYLSVNEQLQKNHLEREMQILLYIT